MTIATGSPILASDVRNAVNGSYPEFSGIEPASLVQGQPFVAGDTSAAPDVASYIAGGGASQTLATALALVSLGNPVRPTSTQTVAGMPYSYTQDRLESGESQGSTVRAATTWQQVIAQAPPHSDVILDDTAAAQAAAEALLSGGVMLGRLLSFYSSTNLGPTFGYTSVTYRVLLGATIVDLPVISIGSPSTSGSSTILIGSDSGGNHVNAQVSWNLTFGEVGATGSVTASITSGSASITTPTTITFTDESSLVFSWTAMIDTGATPSFGLQFSVDSFNNPFSASACMISWAGK